MNPTERFTTRAENYARYRPGYPAAIIDLLRAECNLTPDSVIADIGSGTGILTSLFLRNGNTVHAIEPNTPMRHAAEESLGNHPRFHSIPATAEATTLPDATADLITAAQAFHWFDREKTKAEFRRILKPHGHVILIWNQRPTASTPFAIAYEHLLQTHVPDYPGPDSERLDRKNLDPFFDHGFRTATFDNPQHLDYQSLAGRLLSSSYAPEPGHPNHIPMIEELQKIFTTHQHEDKVQIPCETKIYYGQLP